MYMTVQYMAGSEQADTRNSGDSLASLALNKGNKIHPCLIHAETEM